MNTLSLAYSNNSVKGMTKMTHAQALSSYAEELAYKHAKYNQDGYDLDLDRIPTAEVSELCRLFLETMSRDTSECVYGNDFTVNSDYVCALLNMLKNDTQESREAFAKVVINNIRIYYKEELQQIINDACDGLMSALNEETGRYQYIDQDHGDVCVGYL